MKKQIKKKYLLFIMFILVFSMVGCKVNSSNTPSKIESLNGEVVELKIGDNTSRVNSIEEAVEIAYPSVVVINATSTTSTSSGSGVVIGHSENYTFIVTCCHVVEGYKNYEVITSTGTLFDASLVGGDPMTDLAVIAIEKTDLPEVTLIEDSSTLKIGSDAIAIGNPLGTLGGTVTTGIISATSRNIKMSDGSVHTLIQTDAAINSGNSGGGLFNNQGQLIGIVSAKYSATGVEGLGFAIPSNTVRTIVTDLIKNGYVSGVTNLGVTFSDYYYRTGGFFGSTVKVVCVSYVDPNGSANNLLKKEDILVEIDVHYQDSTKQEVTLKNFSNADEVNEFLNSLDLKIGDKLTFKVKRGSYNASVMEVNVTLVQYVYKES
ncbi:MAG: trypsin-like peptidase domain-containing protein [Bacilli bacterium]|nr:trypsin-like peptidase domain-containing protein [Bacilli bacterium]